MTFRSGPFNGLDRMWKAEDFTSYFATFIGNGVFPNPSTGMQVVESDDMTTIIKPGKCWINGWYGVNDADFVLQHDIADGVLKRIDRIVLRWDLNERDILPQLKKGTFASNPVAPALQRDADVYELALADVMINNGATQITQANITDTRLNSELCGIVHGTVDQVDTTTIFNQYQAWFNSVKDGTEQEIADWQQQQYDDFLVWFATIQDILEGDVAANLANRITGLEQTVTSHLDDGATNAHLAKNIGLEDSEGNFTAVNLEDGMKELFTNVSNGKSLVGGAITDVDPNVVIPTDPTFNDLATAIGLIGGGVKSVQRGVLFSPTDLRTQISIAPIDLNNSIAILHKYSDINGLSASDARGSVEIINEHTIEIYGGLRRSDVFYIWQVVEFEKLKSLQRGLATHNGTDTINISSVDITKSFVISSYAATASNVSNGFRGFFEGVELISPTQLEISKLGGEVHWFVAEF